MKIACLKFTLIVILFCACKKPKPIVFSGQLLLTRKSLVPLSNKKIQIFQSGGSAILSGSSSSTAEAITDANGRFSMTFVPGTTYFAGFSGENISPLTLSNALYDASFPYFFRQNFPEQGYDASKPIFVGKSIDTIVVKVYTWKNITSSDTFGLRGTMINANFDKEYTGIRADSGSTFTLDILTNVLFTRFDCIKKTFANDISFGRVKTISGNKVFVGENQFQEELSAEDEIKKESTFQFNN